MELKELPLVDPEATSPIDTTPTTIKNPAPCLPSMTRRPSKAIFQHSLTHAMEFTALWIPLWDDDDKDLDSDGGFWKAYTPAGVGSRVNDIWSPMSMVLLDVILGHVLDNLVYRFSDTGFWACFKGRVSFWQRTRLCENTPETATVSNQSSGCHSPRPINQQIATALYIVGASGRGAERAVRLGFNSRV